MKTCRVAVLCSLLTLALYATVSCHVTRKCPYMAVTSEVSGMSNKMLNKTRLQQRTRHFCVEISIMICSL